MINLNSRLTPDVFKAKRSNSIPVSLTNITTVKTGTKFYNSYCGSKVIDTSCSVSFKADENVHVSINYIKEKDSGIFYC